MTPRRGIVLLLTLVLAALLAVGAWGQGQNTPRLSDDDYIAIALSQPEIFHPTAGGGTSITSTKVEHADTYVAVDVTSDGQRFRVLIDPRTNKVTQVIRQ